MLNRNLTPDPNQTKLQWEDLNFGAPTIIALANICSHAMSASQTDIERNVSQLSDEAKTILVAASQRGTIDIRASRERVDSVERFLAVCVEHELEQWMLFLDRDKPEQTIRFLDGFRQLCMAGLVIHHLQKDFSLSSSGFDLAKTLNRDDFKELLTFPTEIVH
jgi:hypothetical protein